MNRHDSAGEPPLPVIVNSAAGLRRGGVESRVEEALTAAGIASDIRAYSPSRLAAAIAETARAGTPIVGVAGGDGTLLTAAEVLAGGRTVLAPLPTGTLNHFTRRLGLEDLPAAAAALKNGTVASFPVAVLDDRVFLNTATFGFYADMVRRRERFRGVLRKWPAAVVAFAVTMTRLRMMNVTLVVDGERLERRTGLVWVGVGWGSFPLVHESPDRRSRPDLEIVVLRPTGLGSSIPLIVRTLLRLRLGKKPVRDPALEILHARQLLIHGQHRIGVTIDGEVLRCEPPILIAVQEDALRVVTSIGPPLDPQGTSGSPTGNRQARPA